ncbi:hypothetical protein ACLOJK_033356, partial [Asimina triloba]
STWTNLTHRVESRNKRASDATCPESLTRLIHRTRARQTHRLPAGNRSNPAAFATKNAGEGEAILSLSEKPFFPAKTRNNPSNSKSFPHQMSESETDDSSERSAPVDEVENCREMEEDGVIEYEKQRLQRIRENRAKMEAFGLPKLSSAVLGPALSQRKGVEKGKKKGASKVKDEDDEYRPPEGAAVESSSSEEDEEDDRTASGLRRGSNRKGKKVSSARMAKAQKIFPVNRDIKGTDLADDDAALQQAIALSLEGLPDKPGKNVDNDSLKGRKETIDIPEATRGRKRRKSNDCCAEAGKGNITLRDLKKVANAHDFDWTDKDLSDMIDCFDNNRDGKSDFSQTLYSSSLP